MVSATSISIIIPVYNEESTIEEIIERVKKSLDGYPIEIVVVDDGSRDRTGIILDTLQHQGKIKLLRHGMNRGKGAAIRTALEEINGSITIIQDGDLEYDPQDLSPLIAEVERGSPVVYGSRNLGGSSHGYLFFLLGGKFLSFLTNLLFGSKLTDINTGYKVFRTDLLKSVNLTGTGFDFCEEVTAKILKQGVAIRELPISYHPRRFSEGKKIDAIDGLQAIFSLLKYRFQSA